MGIDRIGSNDETSDAIASGDADALCFFDGGLAAADSSTDDNARCFFRDGNDDVPFHADSGKQAFFLGWFESLSTYREVDFRLGTGLIFESNAGLIRSTTTSLVIPL